MEGRQRHEFIVAVDVKTVGVGWLLIRSNNALCAANEGCGRNPEGKLHPPTSRDPVAALVATATSLEVR